MQVCQRFYPSVDDFRSPFSRDRDRIIHSSYFRRLEYKTQVFLNHSGENFRTRLTHSLEVSQIARTLAKHLGLNQELAEAIALAHDLGHTPFGHVGGDELDRILKQDGSAFGFDHNFQSFRVVSALEKRYRDFDGLNLTFATLEGILKHSEPYLKPFISDALGEVFGLDYHPSLEAIVVDLSDEIAYLSHDIDDGVKHHLLSFELLRESRLVSRVIEYVTNKEKITLGHDIFGYRFTSRLISLLVHDILEHNKPFCQSQPQCFCYHANSALPLMHTKQMAQEIKELKEILFARLYRHEEISKKMFLGKRCIKKLYECLSQDMFLLPQSYQSQIKNGAKIHRVCADYIASMTDRSALLLYQELGL